MREHGKCHPCLGHRREFRDSIGVYQSRQACGRPVPGPFICFHLPGEKLLEGQVIQLEDGTAAYIHQVTIQKGEVSWHVPVQSGAWQPSLRLPPWLHTPEDGWYCSLCRVFLLRGWPACAAGGWQRGLHTPHTQRWAMVGTPSGKEEAELAGARRSTQALSSRRHSLAYPRAALHAFPGADHTSNCLCHKMAASLKHWHRL